MRPLLVVLAFLLLASPAWAGGFATTGLAPLPDGTAAGEPWIADIELLGHGRSPWGGLKPTVIIEKGSLVRRFDAREVRNGVYRANVVFPEPGRWRYSVDSGYGVRDYFAPVTIADRSSAAGAPPARRVSDTGGGPPRWPIALGAGLLTALATGALVRRPPRRRFSPAT